ncbi:MAG: hypothetical protein IKH77_04735 [Clostridia bacterium]|nr:hypothetical protein [Oscillospiraceae bacterium]MBR6954325.1 hypothetical protein [Clostridia bacterium]
MSKKKRFVSPELPQTEGTPEIPNYVIPTTDLEYRQIVAQTEAPAADCGEDRRPPAGR